MAYLHAQHSSGSPKAHATITNTYGAMDKTAELQQSHISYRGCSDKFLKFDITESQLVVYWSKYHLKLSPWEPWLLLTGEPFLQLLTSLWPQKGLCVSYMKISDCGTTL